MDVVGVDGCGFIGLYEGVVYLVNSSGVTQRQINIQHGILFRQRLGTRPQTTRASLRSIDCARRVKALHRLTEVIPHPLYKRSIPRPGLSQLRA